MYNFSVQIVILKLYNPGEREISMATTRIWGHNCPLIL